MDERGSRRPAGQVKIATLGLEPARARPRTGQLRIELNRLVEAGLGLVELPEFQQCLAAALMSLSKCRVHAFKAAR